MKLKLALLSFFIFAPTIALAQSSTITATVVSSVSPTVSTFVSDILQLPADGKSVVVLTATILSKDGTPLPNKKVAVSSNRGDVETILCYSGNSLINKRTTTTNVDGQARCAASSEVPGNATFTAVAEGVTIDDKPTVTFTPLPFLTNLTVKVNLPGGGKLTILEPVKPKPSKPANERLVNTDVELQIPFWVLIVLVLVLLTEPILIILILRLSKKVRRGFEAEKKALAKEQELLAKVYLLESKVVQTASTIEQEVQQLEPPNASNQSPPMQPQGPDAGQSPPNTNQSLPVDNPTDLPAP